MFQSRPLETRVFFIRNLFCLGLGLSAACSSQGWAAQAKAPEQNPAAASVTVHVDQPAARVSPLLYGIFFEDINRSGDGGINAELLRNTTFEEGRDREYQRTIGTGDIVKLTEKIIQSPDGMHLAEPRVPYPWKLEQRNGAEASMELDLAMPLALTNPTSLRLSVTKPGTVQLVNEGFGIPIPDRLQDTPSWANTKWSENQVWGFPVKPGEGYQFQLHLRRDANFTGPVTVRLVGSDGSELASEILQGIGTEWKKFSGTLRPQKGHGTSRFVVETGSTGTLWLDCISLKPATTWKGHGLRKDIMEMIAAMKPKFVRFPGGCLVEGKYLSSQFEWKDTLGELHERPGHWNLWGYMSSNAVGYHEYLQMCEDLGAEPLFVANAGIAHRDALPASQVHKAIQNALDAIEYANGPVTSPWGAKRAKAGHPEPFKMKYIQVGNENGGAIYDDAYALFYDVLKQRAPEVQVIACNWFSKTGVRGPISRPIEILDEHYYDTPTFFLNNATRYDSYDRKGPRIYIGEFAVTKQNGAGNLMAALAESVFMNGMERNGDLVVMGSYAPLLAQPGWVSWTDANAIYNDAGRVYGTPSYWAQVLFGNNRADLNYKVDTKTPEAYLPASGRIGLSANCKSEFKDLVVTSPDGKELYRSDFSRGFGGWQSFGKWETRAGVLSNPTPEPGRAVSGSEHWTDYTVVVKARRMSGNGNFGVHFQMPGLHFASVWTLGAKAQFHVEKFDSEPVPVSIENERWHELKLVVSGPTVSGYLDGQLIQEIRPRPVPALHTIAGVDESTGELVVKAVNLSDAPILTELNLQGAPALGSAGTATILSGASKVAENDFSKPTAVGLKTEAVRGIAPRFNYTFKPNSVTVLRLPPAYKSRAGK